MQSTGPLCAKCTTAYDPLFDMWRKATTMKYFPGREFLTWFARLTRRAWAGRVRPCSGGAKRRCKPFAFAEALVLGDELERPRAVAWHQTAGAGAADVTKDVDARHEAAPEKAKADYKLAGHDAIPWLGKTRKCA